MRKEKRSRHQAMTIMVDATGHNNPFMPKITRVMERVVDVKKKAGIQELLVAFVEQSPSAVLCLCSLLLASDSLCSRWRAGCCQPAWVWCFAVPVAWHCAKRIFGEGQRNMRGRLGRPMLRHPGGKKCFQRLADHSWAALLQPPGNRFLYRQASGSVRFFRS